VDPVAEYKTNKLDLIKSKHISLCQKCGTKHESRKCPAFGSTCNRCGKPNHWAKVCRAKENTAGASRQGHFRSQSQRRGNDWNGKKQTRGRVHGVGARNDDSDSEVSIGNFNIDTLSRGNENEIFTRIKINVPLRNHTMNLRVKIDTGANANILTMRSLKQMYPDKVKHDKPETGFLRPCKTILTAYGGTKINQLGTFAATCKGKNLTFFVVDSSSPNILGLEACRDLGLVKINCTLKTEELDHNGRALTMDILKEKYPQCFDSVGNFPGEFHIDLEEGATPVIHSPRKCPIHIRSELRQELTKMEQLGVIEKVTQPTDWVNSLAYSRKSNGKLRVCLDPRDLNKAIRRVHHNTPTIEEIAHQFAGAKFFTKMDAQHGSTVHQKKSTTGT